MKDSTNGFLEWPPGATVPYRSHWSGAGHSAARLMRARLLRVTQKVPRTGGARVQAGREADRWKLAARGVSFPGPAGGQQLETRPRLQGQDVA